RSTFGNGDRKRSPTSCAGRIVTGNFQRSDCRTWSAEFFTRSALLAKRSDLAIVFAVRVEGEAFDLPDLSLPWGQDAVIDAVAAANPNTIVVIETGNPVSMPWRDKVKAIVQTSYSGQAGGQAIAQELTGHGHPAGRPPV